MTDSTTEDDTTVTNTSKAKEYLAHRKKLQSLLKDWQKEGKTLFKEGAAILFEKFPLLKSFAWTQYAPYFNDGEPCEFSAHTSDCYVNGINYVYSTANPDDLLQPDITDYDDDPADFPAPELTVKQWKEMSEAVAEFLSHFDDSDLRQLFGDDAKVTVTKKKITVDHYDHD